MKLFKNYVSKKMLLQAIKDTTHMASIPIVTTERDVVKIRTQLLLEEGNSVPVEHIKETLARNLSTLLIPLMEIDIKDEELSREKVVTATIYIAKRK